MTSDHFAVLHLPRRPWLEPEALKAAWHQLAARTHPDRTGEAGASAELNAAYSALREPAARLRHLLELEAPALFAGTAVVPEALAEIFLRLATLRRAVEAWAGRQREARSPLTQALLEGERLQLRGEVTAELAGLEEMAARLLAQVRELDTTWVERASEAAVSLYALQQALAYHERWQGQLREAQFQLESGGGQG